MLWENAINYIGDVMIENEFEIGDSVLYEDEVYEVSFVYYGWNGKVSSYRIKPGTNIFGSVKVVNPDEVKPCPMHRQVLESLNEDKDEEEKYIGYSSTTTVSTGFTNLGIK